MAYTYSANLATSANAICYTPVLDGKYYPLNAYTGYYTHKVNAFNGVLLSAATLQQKCENGFYCGNSYSHPMIGQDFGSSPKHIRKIRYHYIEKENSVAPYTLNIRASNNADFTLGQVTIVSNFAYVRGSLAWNEILLPPSQAYRHWMIWMGGVGDGTTYGEIEMMEITGGTSGGSAFLL